MQSRTLLSTRSHQLQPCECQLHCIIGIVLLIPAVIHSFITYAIVNVVYIVLSQATYL